MAGRLRPHGFPTIHAEKAEKLSNFALLFRDDVVDIKDQKVDMKDMSRLSFHCDS